MAVLGRGHEETKEGEAETVASATEDDASKVHPAHQVITQIESLPRA